MHTDMHTLHTDVHTDTYTQTHLDTLRVTQVSDAVRQVSRDEI